MSEFKPLHHLHDLKPKESERTLKAEDVQEEKHNPCEELELRWQADMEKLKDELRALKFQLESLEKEKAKVVEERDRLLRELEDRRAVEELLERLHEKLAEALKTVRVSMEESTIELVKDLLKKILLSQVLPKEDLILRLLSKVLETGIELKGQINLYLNPYDSQRLSPYMERLKEKMGSAVELNILIREDLKEGEFLLETPKLWIERHYENIIQDLLENMKDEGSVQGIS